MAKVVHVYDSSFIMQYTLNLLFSNEVVNIKSLSYKFDYEISSFRKLIYRISYNQTIIDSNFEIKLIKPFCYQRIQIKQLN